MSTTKYVIEEHDAVALRTPIGTWPVGVTGTVVSLYEDAALVEVAEDDPPGSGPDNLLTVPFEQLELCWSHRTGWVDGWKPDGSLNGRDRAARRSAAFLEVQYLRAKPPPGRQLICVAGSLQAGGRRFDPGWLHYRALENGRFLITARRALAVILVLMEALWKPLISGPGSSEASRRPLTSG